MGRAPKAKRAPSKTRPKTTLPKRGQNPSRFVDIGFGRGELIRRFVRAGKDRTIEGVEALAKGGKRTRIKGARLTYKGFEKWLKETKPEAYKLINGDFFFPHFEDLLQMENSKFEPYGIYITRGMMVDAMEAVKEKIVPGGFLTATVPKCTLFGYEVIIKEAGFEKIRSRPLRENECSTESRRIYYAAWRSDPDKKEYEQPMLVVARKPRRKDPFSITK